MPILDMDTIRVCAACNRPMEGAACRSCGTTTTVDVWALALPKPRRPRKTKPKTPNNFNPFAPPPGAPVITVGSLGWGVQSTTMAAMMVFGDLPRVDYLIHADTMHERQDTYRYRAQWQPWLEAAGLTVITVTDKSTTHVIGPHRDVLVPAYTISPDGFSAADYAETGRAGDILPSTKTKKGTLRRQCTSRWKIEPINRAIRVILAERGQPNPKPGAVQQWLGISMDEWHRAKPGEVKYLIHRYPLLEKGMTRADCIAYLEAHGIPVPPKSACVFCPYHSRQAWEDLKRRGGPDWDRALEVDNLIRDRKPPYPIYVHPALQPLDLAVKLPEDYGYDRPVGLLDEADDPSCDSGFCFM